MEAVGKGGSVGAGDPGAPHAAIRGSSSAPISSDALCLRKRENVT
jgi:hypothetical protein